MDPTVGLILVGIYYAADKVAGKFFDTAWSAFIEAVKPSVFKRIGKSEKDFQAAIQGAAVAARKATLETADNSEFTAQILDIRQ